MGAVENIMEHLLLQFISSFKKEKKKSLPIVNYVDQPNHYMKTPGV